jgi:hypothetical protein
VKTIKAITAPMNHAEVEEALRDQAFCGYVRSSELTDFTICLDVQNEHLRKIREGPSFRRNRRAQARPGLASSCFFLAATIETLETIRRKTHAQHRRMGHPLELIGEEK